MCRLAGWIGQPAPLSSITHDPSHALVVQARAPKLMREAALNADGWGAAWYPDDGDPSPVRYRVATPAWSDENLATLAPRVRSACMLGAVRSATPGMPFGAVTNQPFVDGRLAFVHNGYLAPFDAIRRPRRVLLSEEAERLIVGGTDSEHLFALIRTRMAGDESTAAMVAATGRPRLPQRDDHQWRGAGGSPLRWARRRWHALRPGRCCRRDGRQRAALGR